MAGFNDGRPLTELLGSLASDLTGLFRKEVQLAKVEATEKVSQAAGGVAQIAIGGVLALCALFVLLSAAVQALAAFFVSQGMGQTAAESLSALIIGAIIGLIGWVFSRGLSTLRNSSLMLERTATSLQRDAAVVKEKI
jgi:hypothetical protein